MLVEVHRKAEIMLQHIVDYYAEVGGMITVDKFLNTIRQKSEWLLRFPYAGTPEPLLVGRKYFYRFLILNDHIKMIYYVEDDVIHIVAFWDMRMHPKKLKQKI